MQEMSQLPALPVLLVCCCLHLLWGIAFPMLQTCSKTAFQSGVAKLASWRHTTIHFLALKAEQPKGHPVLLSDPAGSPASSCRAQIPHATSAPPAQCGCAGRHQPCTAPTCPATPSGSWHPQAGLAFCALPAAPPASGQPPGFPCQLLRCKHDGESEW